MRSMIVTKHAVCRYIERIRPGVGEQEARADIDAAVGRAERAGVTRGGQVVWAVDDPAMRLVTKHDPKFGAVLVTIVGPRGVEEEWDDDLPFPAHADPAPPSAEQVRAAARAERTAKHDALMAEQKAAKADRVAKAAVALAAREAAAKAAKSAKSRAKNARHKANVRARKATP